MFFAKGRTGTIIFKEIWTGSVKPERKLGGYAKKMYVKWLIS